MNRLSALIASFVFALCLSFGALAADKVNINTADASTIAAALNGVGMAKAEAIVAYRTEHGPFRSADQLVQVRGIGLATVEKNRERILVGNTAPAAGASSGGN
ncbi:MAG: helix-hairpin-helix domain-containing protein [Aquimonas sp.]|nr:helix-hairpin-helix domain-containing protein [Aquimonas sp.]